MCRRYNEQDNGVKTPYFYKGGLPGYESKDQFDHAV